ncbi:putative G3BP-like protein isoform X1 [Tanacetum coccineum]
MEEDPHSRRTPAADVLVFGWFGGKYACVDLTGVVLSWAPSITIGNRQVVVEEKRTTTRVGADGAGGGRGRYSSGRNGGFRGRGGYFGGRSFGRNESRYQGEFRNRSKGPTGRSSEVYKRVDQNGGSRITNQPSKDTESTQ